MRRIAILTSGGDCSGMNAAIRAAVRAALSAGVEVVGIRKGYSGLIHRMYENLNTRSVSGVLQRGGTFLQSARCPEMRLPEGQEIAIGNLKGLGIEGLIVIGGDGSLTGALTLHQQGVKVIGIPASIDNDIACTDMSLGVDTALNNILHAVDALKDTATSHDRAFIVETMGRNCGYLAVVSAVACGAEFAIVPETPYDIEAICESLRKRYREGRDNAILMVAEGAASAQEIATQIQDRAGFETRIMVLGHYQRGGSPSTFDRLLASRFGVAAVEALLAGETGKMVGLQCGRTILTDLGEVIASKGRKIDTSILSLARTLDI